MHVIFAMAMNDVKDNSHKTNGSFNLIRVTFCMHLVEFSKWLEIIDANEVNLLHYLSPKLIYDQYSFSNITMNISDKINYYCCSNAIANILKDFQIKVSLCLMC